MATPANSKDMVAALETAVKDLGVFDSHSLERFLVARSWDLGKAEAMFRKSFKWRKDNNVDSILSSYTPPAEINDYFPGGVHGYDKEGRPLVFDRFAQLDLPGLLRKYGKEEIIKVWIYRTEYMNKIFAEASEKFGKKIFQITLFMDLKGVGAAQGNKVGLDLYQELMAISQDNYPDRLYRAYIINIPPGFSFMWRIVSWFFDEGLKKKFVFVDGDATSGVVMEACKDLVDASNVPKAIGGTWTIGDDEYCTAIIKPGGRVVVDTSLMKPLSISAGSTVAVPIVITRPQSTLSYHFLSEENDIGFSCSHHESTDPAVAAASSNKKILKPMEIVNAHRENQRGTLICDQVGTYTLVFSNSHAWLFSKTVRYEVSVVEPPSDEDLKAREERF